jgi:hypothetical protein
MDSLTFRTGTKLGEVPRDALAHIIEEEARDLVEATAQLDHRGPVRLLMLTGQRRDEFGDVR